jgi:hypothetical protein
VLGGLAYQQVSGKASTFLRSTESEQKLELGAKAEYEAFKGGTKLQAAADQAETRANEYSLKLEKIEFRGGDGGASGIAESWYRSCVDRPAITRASLERLSYLLTPRFFSNKDNIGDLQEILDRAITDWIQTKGRPSRSTAPLRYDEPVVMVFPWADGKTKQIGVIDPAADFSFSFQVRNSQPYYDESYKVGLRILSGDGSNKDGVILAGDQVRIESIDKGFLAFGDTVHTSGASQTLLKWTNSPSDAARFTVLHQEDNLSSPGRLGEYFQESDLAAFLAVGVTGLLAMATDRSLSVFPGAPSNVSGFYLVRCAEQEES